MSYQNPNSTTTSINTLNTTPQLEFPDASKSVQYVAINSEVDLENVAHIESETNVTVLDLNIVTDSAYTNHTATFIETESLSVNGIQNDITGSHANDQNCEKIVKKSKKCSDEFELRKKMSESENESNTEDVTSVKIVNANKISGLHLAKNKSNLRSLSLFFLLVLGMGLVMALLIDDNVYHGLPFSEHGSLDQNAHDNYSVDEITDNSRREFFFGSSHNQPVVNCTPLAIYQFPTDLFTQTQRRHGALIFHCVLIVYMFLALAIVCDEFFVPALECLCDKLDINPDVAGATFMAIGSSTPELFTSVIGVFITKDDIGIGTIVGSAVFNIIFIISLCGLLTDNPIELTWYPLMRDCSFYTISIFALFFIIYDHTVYWYEAFSLLILYLFYILLMYCNESLSSMANSVVKRWSSSRDDNKHGEPGCCACCCCYPKINNKYTNVPLLDPKGNPTKDDSFQLVDEESDNEPRSSDSEEEIINSKYGKKTKNKKQSELSINRNGVLVVTGQPDNHNGVLSAEDKEINLGEDVSSENENEKESLLQFPETSSLWNKFLWVVSMPLYVILTFTVPSCRNSSTSGGSKLWVIFLSFVMSTAWIALFSYLLVWMVTVLGYTLSIPDTIMGLTLLAAGTSVPDAMSSVIVARNGEGDMAVSNSIGSNIFDILLCLGLPWLMKSIKSPVLINSSGLTYISFTLVTTVILLVLVIMCNRWVLNRKMGVFLLFIYFIFIVYASLVESNKFGYVNPPSCPP